MEEPDFSPRFCHRLLHAIRWGSRSRSPFWHTSLSLTAAHAWREMADWANKCHESDPRVATYTPRCLRLVAQRASHCDVGRGSQPRDGQRRVGLAAHEYKWNTKANQIHHQPKRHDARVGRLHTPCPPLRVSCGKYNKCWRSAGARFTRTHARRESRSENGRSP